jgi:nucleotide-binding universal stress UspA family protein
MFEKILVATDGLKYAEDAANEALDMAKLNKATLIALYVVDAGKEFAFSDVSANIADDVVQGIKKSLVDSGDKAIKRIAEKAKMTGIVFEGKVVEGHPPTDISKMAGKLAQI